MLGFTALMLAVCHDQIEIVKLLLDTGDAHPEYQNKEGDTALMYAVSSNNIDAVENWRVSPRISK